MDQPAQATPPAGAPAAQNAMGQNTGGRKRYSTLVEVLLDQGKLTTIQSDDISLEQIRTGKSPDTILEEKGYVSEQDLTEAKSLLYNIPLVDIDTIGASPEALAQVPDGIAKRYNVLPFRLDRANNELQVVMADPLDLQAIEFVERKTGLRMRPSIAPVSDIQRAIAERYAQSLSSEVSQALKDTSSFTGKKVFVAGETDKAIASGEVVREAPIAKIVETVLSFALKSRASDVHIEPMEERTRIRYRIDGILQEKLVLPKSVHEGVVSRIKILSDLKIDEKRLPQDGRFTFRSGEEEVDLRVSTLPTVHGEKVVMRLLQKSDDMPSLNELGMVGLAYDRVQEAIRIPHGIVLVTGPTGSGKTTTLYSILNKINSPKVNIMTLEDPVEYQLEGINQVQVNPQAGLTFASGLRSFLRQDPNIIMVGEIRDEETAELAIQASLTGHLVFSTVHTNSAAGALPRLIDMKAEPFLLASSITLVMAQRVVRKLNPDVAEEYVPPAEVLQDIKETLGPVFEQYLQKKNITEADVRLSRARADRPTNASEYHGRIGIFEVLPVTKEISNMILQQKSAAEIEIAAAQSGMLLMKQDGYIKAMEGVTTLEEVLRVAQT
ncbi:Flp pilus assembly complex ATPase component TadA [Candidatus Woesebacteria bacterium]|nr:Flp pilus assembly complex ATPase component TadA [Candidatus Woesebacteria bacterium]MCD8507241.1 Flp pilus assembly complex ATPase component TadA [Candidatus Woesebacteria bacterium]MCD8526624.1 Flp pilus assembly complex ATPase component TadA [Candidatus Woesebacteria bacterium]